jgi:ABC-2 type transport system permease protein
MNAPSLRSGFSLAGLGQIGWIARRSIRRTLRQPALIVPTIVFPLFLMAVNSSGLAAATKLPGFPTNNYLSFSLSVCFMQGALFAATTAGAELATDIETGFLNRLSLTPLRGVAVLVGQLAGAVVVSLTASVVYLAVGLIAGADLAAGVGGALVLLALATLVGIAFGAIGLLMALRTGSAEAVQGLFPLMFVLFFLSSINLPRNLIATDWFRAIATYNPVSYLVEGIRSLVITGWDGEALALGFGMAAALAALSFAAAGRALRTRLTRT